MVFWGCRPAIQLSPARFDLALFTRALGASVACSRPGLVSRRLTSTPQPMSLTSPPVALDSNRKRFNINSNNLCIHEQTNHMPVRRHFCSLSTAPFPVSVCRFP